MTNTKDKSSKEHLVLAAIDAISAGRTVKQTAKDLDIGYSTLRRWLNTEKYRTMLRQHTIFQQSLVSSKISSMTDDIVNVLSMLLYRAERDSDKIASAKVLLDLMKTSNISVMHSDLEAIKSLMEIDND